MMQKAELGGHYNELWIEIRDFANRLFSEGLF